MRTLVTGAGGFIGLDVVAALTERARASAQSGRSGDALLLTDLAASLQPRSTASLPLESCTMIAGDLGDPSLLALLFTAPIDTVFHFAGIVSGAAERDFALGKRVNLDATIALLEHCRAQAEARGPIVRFVYASSIAVFGTPLPSLIDDNTVPFPTLSYGTQKRACELLIDDYSRRGFIDGRALRLPGVVVRPPLANGALSAFNSDLIREPLAGRDYTCPVSPEATIWITSRHANTANLLRLAELDAAAIGPVRAITSPAIAARVDAVVAATARLDPRAAGLVRFEADPALEAQFGRWPLACAFAKAQALGLATDASLDALLRTCIEPS
jgi:nucleoside-diphosphate-sugar epimerase